jgi:hypothetical protein
MENENDNGAQQPDGGTPQPVANPGGGSKRLSDGQIFGLNFLIFIGYTVICALTAQEGGFIFDGLLLICHLLVGVILAAAYRRWAWGVAGLLAFIIGVSICAGGLGAFR